MTDWPAIVATHGPGVWRTVYRLLAHHADALDCYQETFLAAFRAPVGVHDWGAYLTTLATRRAVDRLRQRSRLRSLTLALEQAPPPAIPDPSDRLAADELTAVVRDALAGLPDRQAEVFWLSAIEGLPHDAIAAHLKTSPGAVRVLLHRGRTALAAALGSHSITARSHP